MSEDDSPDLFGKGFLTAGDTKFLHGEEEFRSSVESQKRHRIKKRGRNALNDFNLFFNALPADDRKDLWDVDQAQYAFMRSGLIRVLAMYYQHSNEEDLERLLERAITASLGSGVRAKNPQPDLDGVSVDLDVETFDRVNIGELAEKIDREGVFELSNAEMSVVFRLMKESGEVPESGDELKDLYDKHGAFQGSFMASETEDSEVAVRTEEAGERRNWPPFPATSESSESN